MRLCSVKPSREWKVMHVERGDYAAEMLRWNSGTVQHRREFCDCMIFMFEGEKDWNNEKLHSLFFCVRSLPSLKTPPQIAKQKSNHLWPGVPPLSLSVFGCLIIKSETNCTINLNDCGNIYLLAVPKLHGSLNDWVNIHHVRCCVLLITLQCCSNFNPHKYRSRFDYLFMFPFFRFSHSSVNKWVWGENQFTFLSPSMDQNFNTLSSHPLVNLLVSSLSGNFTESPLIKPQTTTTRKKLQIASFKMSRHRKS